MKKFHILLLSALFVSFSACKLPVTLSSPSTEHTSFPTQPTIPTLPPSPQATTPPVSPPVSEAGVIFHNGVILTMNRAQPTAQAIFVQGGKIEAVGGNADILALQEPDTETIDLGGLTLMPGFVDAHTHIFLGSSLVNTDAAGAQILALGYGVTSVGELAGGEPHLLYLRDLGNTGQIRLRVSIYPSVYNEGCEGSVFDQDWYKAYPPGAEIAPNVRMGGIKLYTDGSGCVPPAVSFEYAGDAGHGTLFFESPEKLAAVLKVYYDQGYQIAIHTIGDRAVEQVQQAIATFPPEARDFNHFRTEHNAVIRPDLMKAYTDLGIVGVLFGGYPTCFIANRTDEFIYATPDEYLHWEWPWKSLLEANPNGHFAYHSDAFGVTPLNPFEHLMAMTTRREFAEDGSICEPPPLLEQNKITIEQALELMTIGGAYALDQEDKVGSLEPGKFADLIVLSQNPLTTQPEDFKDIKVYLTLVGGKVEYCAVGSESLCPSTSPLKLGVAPTQPAFSSPVAASASLFESPAANATDGNFDTVWNSGTHPEQWIMLNLGAPQTVRAIRLHVAQYPDGETVHQVWVGSNPNNLSVVHEFKGMTTDGQVLEFLPSTPQTNVQYIKIVTTQSPSWVAWREIEVIGE